MTMASMTRNEWRYWQDREDVTFRKLTAIGEYDSFPMAASGGAAKRRAPTWKEMTASAGAVTSKNLVWLLPDANLPEGVLPRAGDQIRDLDDNDHTVLEVAVGKFAQTHRCVTIALAVVYELSATGVLTRPTNAQDAAGRMALTSYAQVGGRVRCRVQPQDSDAADVFERRTLPRKFTALLDTPIVPRARDVFTVTTYAFAGGAITGTQAYTVLAFRQPERLDQLMSLDLELIA